VLHSTQRIRHTNILMINTKTIRDGERYAASSVWLIGRRPALLMLRVYICCIGTDPAIGWSSIIMSELCSVCLASISNQTFASVQITSPFKTLIIPVLFHNPSFVAIDPSPSTTFANTPSNASPCVNVGRPPPSFQKVPRRLWRGVHAARW
jgi:hypothetical protein